MYIWDKAFHLLGNSPFGKQGLSPETLPCQLFSVCCFRFVVFISVAIFDLIVSCFGLFGFLVHLSGVFVLECMVKNKYRCCCRCNQCRQTPGCRRVACDCCGYLVGPGCCLAVEDVRFTICHVCNRDSYRSRCEGLYKHWQFGPMWEAYVCFLVLWLSASPAEPDPEP